jgi:starvation-inducible DNA-binding protein
MTVNTGIAAQDRQAIAEGLARLLADSYTLYLKTHNFHWNVTGPNFVELHGLFEQHYTELATAVDEIAERIRALGAPAPGSYRAFAALTAIEEAEDHPNAMEHEKTAWMLRAIVE